VLTVPEPLPEVRHVPPTEKHPAVRLIPLAKVELADVDDAIKYPASINALEEIPPAKVEVAVEVAVTEGSLPGFTLQLVSPGEHEGSRVSPGAYCVVGGAALTVAKTSNDDAKNIIKKNTFFLLIFLKKLIYVIKLFTPIYNTTYTQQQEMLWCGLLFYFNL